MWPAPDELTRGAPADSAAAANDILPSIELTPARTRRRDSESRGNAFSRSPKRSDSEMSDGAPTVVQVPPSQPSMTDNLLRALIHEIHTLSLKPSRSMLAINMRLDQELVHRTSSTRPADHHTARVKTAERANLTRRVHLRLRRSEPPIEGNAIRHRMTAQALPWKRRVVRRKFEREQRHAGGDARRDVDTTPKRTENRKNSKKSESVAETSSSPGESDTRRSKKSALSQASSISDGGKSRASRRTSSEGSSSESSPSDDSSSDSDASRHRRKGKHHSKEKAASKKSKHGTSKRGEPRRSDEQIMKRLQNWKISFAGGDRGEGRNVYHATGQMPRRHKRRRSALDRCGPGHAERRSGSVVPAPRVRPSSLGSASRAPSERSREPTTRSRDGSERPIFTGGDNDARSPRRASATSHQRQDRAHAMESDELFWTMISSSERTSRTSGRWTRRPWKANGVYTKALGCRSTEK
ncbi:unnamed protein product, partial [Trichogramma brassicae]